MADQYFHLTIGPVQAFVAQARRTRDFWAGSFILSFLSSVAMVAVRQQEGDIEFPLPDEDYLSWLKGDAEGGVARPLQGSVPNRFKAMEVKVSEGFDPDAVVAAVKHTWRELAELVWQSDLQGVTANAEQHRTIWDRQIDNFWEISWCITADKGVSNLLDRRKNWRSHIVADEPGVKCSLMEGYQELSGQLRPGESVRDFWYSVCEQNEGLSRDLREDEHLCAIAFVKRRFAHFFNRLNVQLPAVGQHEPETLRGWPLPKTVPSIAYMAAMPWLAAVARSAVGQPKIALVLKQLEHALGGLDSPWEGRVANYIAKACEEAGYQGGKWQQVNGQYLFRSALEQSIKEAKRTDSLTADQLDSLEAVAEHLRELRQLGDFKEPSPFYAILLMDGDSLGIQMSDTAKQGGISEGLNNFTRGVPAVIQKHSGFLVYAGGDDVLAILPQPFAIDCAHDVKHFYDECFRAVNAKNNEGVKITTSISAGINYAHYKTPLTQVLFDSHQLLDDVAKEQTGRNSLAVRVWKSSGMHAQWSAPWVQLPALQEVSAQVAEHLQGDLSRSFFFKLEDLIVNLQLQQEHNFAEEHIASLVRAAWTHTGNQLETLPAGIEIQLLEACRMVTRQLHDDGSETIDKKNHFAAGALKLIQFLATENQSFLGKQDGVQGEAQ